VVVTEVGDQTKSQWTGRGGSLEDSIRPRGLKSKLLVREGVKGLPSRKIRKKMLKDWLGEEVVAQVVRNRP